MFYGVDVGRGAVKGVTATDQISFPSYLAAYRERDLVSQSSDILKQLVVAIDGDRYFVGELARREGGLSTLCACPADVAAQRLWPT